jgi:hypothetical protein
MLQVKASGNKLHITRQLSKYRHRPTCYRLKLIFHSVTCHEDTEGEQRYGSTLSLTSALDGGGWSTPRPGRFTHCTGGWVGPRAGLDECGKPLIIFKGYKATVRGRSKDSNPSSNAVLTVIIKCMRKRTCRKLKALNTRGQTLAVTHSTAAEELLASATQHYLNVSCIKCVFQANGRDAGGWGGGGLISVHVHIIPFFHKKSALRGFAQHAVITPFNPRVVRGITVSWKLGWVRIRTKTTNIKLALHVTASPGAVYSLFSSLLCTTFQ